MEQSNSIRNGIIATVGGGIILAALAKVWPPAQVFFLWGWEQVVWFGNLFVRSYAIKGWILIGLILIGLPTIIRLIGMVHKEAPHTKYKNDQIFGSNWEWDWANNKVSNLWCLCPKCHSELIYDDSSCGLYSRDPSRTDFICEHCNRTVASIPGGNKSYALSAVEREIRRRIRTDEYQK